MRNQAFAKSLQKTTSADTRAAVIAAFNLDKSPNSASEWITADCDAETGVGDLRALHLVRN